MERLNSFEAILVAIRAITAWVWIYKDSLPDQSSDVRLIFGTPTSTFDSAIKELADDEFESKLQQLEAGDDFWMTEVVRIVRVISALGEVLPQELWHALFEAIAPRFDELLDHEFRRESRLGGTALLVDLELAAYQGIAEAISIAKYWLRMSIDAMKSRQSRRTPNARTLADRIQFRLLVEEGGIDLPQDAWPDDFVSLKNGLAHSEEPAAFLQSWLETSLLGLSIVSASPTLEDAESILSDLQALYALIYMMTRVLVCDTIEEPLPEMQKHALRLEYFFNRVAPILRP